MPLLIRNSVRFVLLSVLLTAIGCSWPGVKIGGDTYLLAPPAVETKK